MKWQPIETAPKDGTEIVLWARGGYAISGVVWSDGRWREWTYFGLEAIEEETQPTHWLKIVPPSKEVEG